jgi:5-methylcytosine-specific restriction protein A
MTRRTGPTQETRDAAFERDGGCIICGETYDLHLHHRRARGAGGTRRPETNGLANLIVLCAEHHRFVESHRELALDRGLLVSQHQTPQDVSLIYKGEWCHLYDDGRVSQELPAHVEDDQAVQDYLRGAS